MAVFFSVAINGGSLCLRTDDSIALSYHEPSTLNPKLKPVLVVVFVVHPSTRVFLLHGVCTRCAVVLLALNPKGLGVRVG